MAWVPLSAGEGNQGPRLYEWAWLHVLQARKQPGVDLVVADSSQRVYYRAWCPTTTPLMKLVRVVGSRWTVEEGFEQAKGEVGLDQYEVRGFRAWYHFITLAQLAHAFLAVIRLQTQVQEQKRGW